MATYTPITDEKGVKSAFLRLRALFHENAEGGKERPRHPKWNLCEKTPEEGGPGENRYTIRFKHNGGRTYNAYVRPKIRDRDNSQKVHGLFVKNEMGHRFLTHDGHFDEIKQSSEKFREFFDSGDWIDVEGETKPRFVIAQIDDISAPDLVQQISEVSDVVLDFKKKKNDPSTHLPRDSHTEDTSKQNTPKTLNCILFGPPGTGKTYEAVSRAVAIIDRRDPGELANSEQRKQVKERFDELKEQGRIDFVTFHQNYTYEDFIEGIRPVLGPSKSDGENDIAPADKNHLTYKLHNGIFKEIAQQAEDDGGKRYVLIIDEINRGNIAKIFGELITLIEPSKRLGGDDEARATLPYSGQSFGVPNNLYILGTMNTADRSIALLDTALRRRFHFIEMMPNPDLVEQDIEGVDGQELLTAINGRIKAKLDREHQIGHTYLMGVKDINALADAFQRSILPLLQEYFYDDWDKIQYVLNGNPFVREDASAPSDSETDRTLFERLPHGDPLWRQAGSYQQIYAPAGRQEGDDGG